MDVKRKAETPNGQQAVSAEETTEVKQQSHSESVKRERELSPAMKETQEQLHQVGSKVEQSTSDGQVAVPLQDKVGMQDQRQQTEAKSDNLMTATMSEKLEVPDQQEQTDVKPGTQAAAAAAAAMMENMGLQAQKQQIGLGL